MFSLVMMGCGPGVTNAAGDHGLTQTGLRLQLEPAWHGTSRTMLYNVHSVLEELVLLYTDTSQLQPRRIIDSTPLPNATM